MAPSNAHIAARLAIREELAIADEPTPGQRIRIERTRLGMSVEDFAVAGGVTPAEQRQYEAGELRGDAAYLAKIAGTNADLVYILTGSDIHAERRFAAIGQATRVLERAGASARDAERLQSVLVAALAGVPAGQDR